MKGISANVETRLKALATQAKRRVAERSSASAPGGPDLPAPPVRTPGQLQPLSGIETTEKALLIAASRGAQVKDVGALATASTTLHAKLEAEAALRRVVGAWSEELMNRAHSLNTTPITPLRRDREQMERAERLFALGCFDAAEAELEKVFVSNGDRLRVELKATGWELHARIYLHKSAHGVAEKSLTHAFMAIASAKEALKWVDSQADYARSALIGVIAQAHLQMGDTAAAAEALATDTAWQPDQFTAALLARAWGDAAAYDEARKNLSRFAHCVPESAAVLALLHALDGREAESMRCVEKALSSNGYRAVAHMLHSPFWRGASNEPAWLAPMRRMLAEEAAKLK